MNRSTLNKHHVDKIVTAREQQQQHQQNADINSGSGLNTIQCQSSRRRGDLNRQFSGALVTVDDSTEPIVISDHQRRWKCGYPAEKWVKLFALIDIVKGTFGLIFAAYVAISIFRLMAKTPDFTDVKRKLRKTEFVYLIAYGSTSLGISLSVCGMALYHFLLIVFGKILFDGANERSTAKLRLWYIYAFLSTIVFIFLYCRLIFASLECSELQLCQAEHNTTVWIVAICYYLLSFVPSIYSILIAKSLLNEICRQRKQERRSMALSQSESRSQSQTQFQAAAQNSHSTNNLANNYNTTYDTYERYMTAAIKYEPKINFNPALHPRGFNL